LVFGLLSRCYVRKQLIAGGIVEWLIRHLDRVQVRQLFKLFLFLGQQPLVPLLLLGPPIFPINLFGSTTLLTGMTSISLHMQWPPTSQLHGSVSQREQLVFHYGLNSTSGFSSKAML
jgi:hypothetical protein